MLFVHTKESLGYVVNYLGVSFVNTSKVLVCSGAHYFLLLNKMSSMSRATFQKALETAI